MVWPTVLWISSSSSTPSSDHFPSASTGALLWLFLEVVGGFVTPLYEMQVNFSRSLSVAPVFSLFFRAHIHGKPVFRLHLHGRCVHLLAGICAFKHASVFATAQTQGGKSNAVAMES